MYETVVEANIITPQYLYSISITPKCNIQYLYSISLTPNATFNTYTVLAFLLNATFKDTYVD